MKFLLPTAALSLCASLMCMATPLNTFTKNKEVAGVHKMTFGVKRGNNYADSSYFGKPRFVKRENEDGTVNVELENKSSFYLVDLEIGSDNQTIGVLIDTGSSDLWVMGSDNPYCESSSNSASKSVSDKLFLAKGSSPVKAAGHRKDIGGGGGGPPEIGTTSEDGDYATQIVSAASPEATIDCSTYGTFDESSSKSYHSNDTEFLIQYADYTFAYGNWGRDDVTLGGVTVSGLSFAVANESNSTIGVLGIGLSGLETTYAGSLTQTTYQYENLPLKMVQEGLIHKAAYSLYLGSSDSTSGTILFGGVDHSKYTGSLKLLPIINSLSNYNFDSPIKLEITLSGVSMDVGNGEAAIFTSTLAPALLDSGTTLTYAPQAVMIKIGEALGASYSSAVGAYVMECLDSSNTSTIDFEFSGVTISVPITDLLVQTSETNYCAIGIISSGDNTYILGDSFLRSAYVVYDLTDLQIGLAQSNHKKSSENIQAIVSSIPSAVTAAGYSSTFSSAVYESNTQISYGKASATAVSNSTSGSDSDSDSDSSSSSSSSGSGSSSSSSSSSESKKSSASKSDFNSSLVYAIAAAITLIMFGL